jgi:DNA-binding MarR family transcriptional regulator
MTRSPRSTADTGATDPTARTRTEDGFDLWRRAMRWQRAVDAALQPLGLTHTRYLLLSAVDRVQRSTGDAVMQRAAAEAAGLDTATTCNLIRVLDERGWVNRGPDGLDARRVRVIVTAAGRRLLARAGSLVEASAAEFFES